MTYLDGAALRELPPAQLWRTISYVPQMRAASAAYTVEETVLLGRSARIGPFALPGQADVQAAEAAMDRLACCRSGGKNAAPFPGGRCSCAAGPGRWSMTRRSSFWMSRSQIWIFATSF